jgi:hypothetical protein
MSLKPYLQILFLHEKLVNNKNSSLFLQRIDEEENKLCNIFYCCQYRKHIAIVNEVSRVFSE